MKPRRENWKGRYVIVLRDDRGRILARRRWQQSFSIKDAKKVYSQNKTFNPKVEKRALVKVRERFDFRERPRRVSPTTQYVFQAKIEGKMISGRSHQTGVRPGSDDRKETLVQEAQENFHRLVAWKVYGDSDEELGAEYISEHAEIEVREGWVSYAAM